MSMSPELIIAIKERISAGHPKEQIKSEVLSTGYTESVFEEAYLVASEEDVTVEDLNSLVSAPDTHTVTPTAEVHNSAVTTALPSYSDFISTTWNLALNQFPVFLKITGVCILLFGILGSLMFVLMGGMGNLSLFGNSTYLLFIAAALAAFFVIVLSFLVLIRALLRRHHNESLMTHFTWTLKNTWGLLVVSFVTVAVIMAGYIFFIIPGLMLVVYLFFTLFFYADGKSVGIRTMTMSTEYTYGRFWPIFSRVILLGVLIYVAMMVVGMISMLTVFLAPFFIFFFTIISYHLSYCGYVVLYESILRAGIIKPLPIKENSLKYIFIAISTIAIILVALLIGGLMFLSPYFFDSLLPHTPISGDFWSAIAFN